VWIESNHDIFRRTILTFVWKMKKVTVSLVRVCPIGSQINTSVSMQFKISQLCAVALSVFY
jgi:hypothetical protein